MSVLSILPLMRCANDCRFSTPVAPPAAPSAARAAALLNLPGCQRYPRTPTHWHTCRGSQPSCRTRSPRARTRTQTQSTHPMHVSGLLHNSIALPLTSPAQVWKNGFSWLYSISLGSSCSQITPRPDCNQFCTAPLRTERSTTRKKRPFFALSAQNTSAPVAPA